MKFDEKIKTVLINEANVTDIVKINDGRAPGEDVLDFKGKPIKNRKILDATDATLTTVEKDGSTVKLTQMSVVSKTPETIYLTGKDVKLLQKLAGV